MPSTPEHKKKQQIEELFASCKRREGDLQKVDIDQVRHEIAKAHIFRPIFEAVPQVRNETEKLLLAGIKYQILMAQLEKAPNRLERWILLARWLWQENVCEPVDFLPKEAKLDSLLTKPWKGTRGDDPLYVSLVDIWLPYFETLMNDIKDLKGRKRRLFEGLVNNGYDQDAVRTALTKRSAVEAVYSWLHIRRKVSPETFRNAYARTRASISRLPHDQAARIFAQEIKKLAEQGRTSGLLKGHQPSGKRDEDS